MARDRQRAKQRRRRQSADGGQAAPPAARPNETGEDLPRDPAVGQGHESEPADPAESRTESGSSADARDDLDAAQDAGVDDVLDERGPDGTTPTPDPLKHASPYVDEAKLAETGTPVEDPYEDRGDEPYEEGAERAPDDLGYSSSHADSSGRESHAGAVAPTHRRGRATTFLRNSAQELKRVQWPDRRQTGQGTAVTLGFVVLAGGFLGLMDAIWRPIVEAII